MRRIYMMRVTALMVLVGWMVLLPGVSSGQKPGARSGRRPLSREYWLNPALPPMTHEADAIRTVWDRFPDARPKELVPFLRSYYSQEIRQFAALSRTNKDRAVRQLAALFEEALDMMEQRARDPGWFDLTMRKKNLDAKADRLVSALDKAKTSDERERYREELREVLREIFDIKHTLMKKDVNEMSRELDKLSGLIRMREGNREAIIERRLADLTSKAEDLKW